MFKRCLWVTNSPSSITWHVNKLYAAANTTVYTKQAERAIAPYIFDEVTDVWPNSWLVTPAVMCSSLKCGQQTTLSRTVADYTTAPDRSCVIAVTAPSGKQQSWTFWLTQSYNFNTVNAVILGGEDQWTSELLSQSPAFSFSIKPFTKGNTYCSQWHLINNTGLQWIVTKQITAKKALFIINNWSSFQILIKKQWSVIKAGLQRTFKVLWC